MSRLTVEQIRNVVDCPTKEVDVPGWGGSVLIGRLTLKQRNAIMAASSVNGAQDSTALMQRIVLHGVVDPPLDEAWIGEKSAAVIDFLAEQIMEHNGWSKEAGKIQDATFRPAS